MSATAAAFILFCAGNPAAAAQVNAGNVAVLRLPINDVMLDALKRDPPISSLKFVGDAGPKAEWIISGRQNSLNGYTTLVRLSKSGDPLSPYAFQAGRAIQNETGDVIFETMAQGKCDIRPVSVQFKGEAK